MYRRIGHIRYIILHIAYMSMGYIVHREHRTCNIEHTEHNYGV
jgi:hypothetical protein